MDVPSGMTPPSVVLVAVGRVYDPPPLQLLPDGE
jgi:hypothetical protein